MKRLKLQVHVHVIKETKQKDNFEMGFFELLSCIKTGNLKIESLLCKRRKKKYFFPKMLNEFLIEVLSLR